MTFYLDRKYTKMYSD